LSRAWHYIAKEMDLDGDDEISIKEFVKIM
jgi:hypothetical protein